MATSLTTGAVITLLITTKLRVLRLMVDSVLPSALTSRSPRPTLPILPKTSASTEGVVMLAGSALPPVRSIVPTLGTVKSRLVIGTTPE